MSDCSLFARDHEAASSQNWLRRFVALSAAFAVLCRVDVGQSAEVRLVHPMIVDVKVLQGEEQPVCAAYAAALEQTIFTNYPHCGRWSVTRTPGFDQAPSQALSVSEYRTLYDSVQPFYFPGYRADQQNFANEKAKKIQRYGESKTLSLDFTPTLGADLLIEPPSAHWLKTLSQDARLVLWDQNQHECGHEYPNGRVGEASIDVLVVGRSGEVDTSKTALLLRALTSKQPGQAGGDKPLTKDSLVAHSFGAFTYGHEYFLDTFEGNPVVGGASSTSFEGSLLVFALHASPLELTQMCKMRVIERKKPWRFAN